MYLFVVLSAAFLCKNLIINNKKIDKFAQMSIHIGNIIQDYVAENRISVTKLATLLNKNRSTIYNIFDRKGIDSELLLEISQKLKHNFFEYYSKDLERKGIIISEKQSNPDEKDPINVSLMESLENKLAVAEKEITLLREINTLLKEKIKEESD